MNKTIQSACAILACSLLAFLAGCSSGLTFGPTIERRAIVVRAGTGVEILTQVEVEARVLPESSPENRAVKSDIFKQDVGGWIALHPDHWESVKREVMRLQQDRQKLLEELQKRQPKRAE